MIPDTIKSLEMSASLYMRFSIAFGLIALGCVYMSLYLEELTPGIRNVIPVFYAINGVALLYTILKYKTVLGAVHDYRSSLSILQSLLDIQSSEKIKTELASLESRYRHVPLIEREIQRYRPDIQTRLKAVENREQVERDVNTKNNRSADLKRHFTQIRNRISNHVDSQYEASPATRADWILTDSISRLTAHKSRIKNAWEEAEKKMSWWQRLNTDSPDFKDIDGKIETLHSAQKRLTSSGEPQKTRANFDAVAARATKRLAALENMALISVPPSHQTPYDDNAIAKSALWLAALSVPVSAWSDITRAGDIYATLRSVNGNFAELSDAEIWLQSLMLPGESLVGLVSLTKGAYFETLVADDTGGELFAEFNHPDTDIVIDGVAYQLKATDSVAYLDTVADGVPIIATSEVAQASEAIDSGITNADLERATELALGGSVLDIQDTAVDAVLTGIGGLGLLATIRGVGHAACQYNAGRDGEDAILEGAGVAITGTAKAFVDTAELGYKALTSRPSRFVGRQFGKLASRIGRAIDGEIP